jgi:hypothetical protein
LFNQYAGIVGYADDNWLLAPSRAALQIMIKNCEEYVNEHNLRFSTNIGRINRKTKCMLFQKHSQILDPTPNLEKTSETECCDKLSKCKKEIVGTVLKTSTDSVQTIGLTGLIRLN